MNCKLIQVVTALIVLGLSSCQYCSAQAACNGFLTGTFSNGVICVGGNNCNLDGATVFGNVMCSSGTLLVSGNSLITGSVLLNDQITQAELDSVTVLGAIQVTDADILNELVVTELADLGPVTVFNAPGTTVRVSGSLQGLDLNNSGDLIASNLNTNASVSVKNANGLIQLCASFLGGLLVEQHTGDIEINSNTANCDPTTINGGLNANKGSGQVQVIGASLPNGDFSISEYTGNIILQDIPAISDIKSEKNIGSLTISNVTAGSDTIIIEQVGDIVLRELNINGDFAVTVVDGDITAGGINLIGDFSLTNLDGNVAVEEFNTAGDFLITEVDGRVVLQDSEFALEDISITLVTGTAMILRNTNFSFTVEGINGEVKVIENTVTNGNINKNTGGVVINNNVFTSLSCTDNMPVPVGSGNIITFGDGQCNSGL